jgi:hypothetical protein
MMGYSRVGSQSLFRAFRAWTFKGFADAGPTCSPSFGMLRNREVRVPCVDVLVQRLFQAAAAKSGW